MNIYIYKEIKMVIMDWHNKNSSIYKENWERTDSQA